ncbi:hypothetical protein EJ05DRAFT_534275 [Pseudovirgaria hyperparasitica]|uniref:ER transporter 6TM N-terminal domain-containing protein n=1 Tax=Pseudovirgaria hyperparasitica TaxID=470096 RepID=A0A6A6WKU4_9PEZI|nr:uncharacterized protein EJ05DRAFT_534275 [Pseudovirgaria hyperparasitica]KAF2762797.1 hypothetical protein EJ05DRAFT_534275 [Pseudovirgaria hyperparasitica]
MTMVSDPSSSAASAPEHEGHEQQHAKSEKKVSLPKRMWTSLDLDLPTVLIMAKGALPPAIVLGMLQANVIITEFNTLGYLVAIASVLGMCILPRAKFLQFMITNVVMICVGAAVVLLEIYCSVKARQHTAPPPTSAKPTYNSSASAVCAIWLFFMTWLINTIRAKHPQSALPTVLVSIFVDVASIYGANFTTMTQGITFTKRLLESFLLGFAIATGVSLFIIPVTSRSVVFKELTGYIGLLRATLQGHSAYFESLRNGDWLSFEMADGQKQGKGLHNKAARDIQTTLNKLTELHGKVVGDLPFAKSEFAIGYLGGDDIGNLFKLLRMTLLPMTGLSSIADVFSRLADLNNLNTFRAGIGMESVNEEQRHTMIKEWQEVMNTVQPTFQSIIDVMDEGLQHVLYTLKLAKPPKKTGSASDSNDVEKKAVPSPGDEGFSDYLQLKSQEFYEGKEVALRTWCEDKGIQLSADFFHHKHDPLAQDLLNETASQDSILQRNQRQLFILLYMEFLLYNISQTILDLTRWADGRVASGKLSKRRLIWPNMKRLRKWFKSAFGHQEDSDAHRLEDGAGLGKTYDLGSAYNNKRDPEHLPPSTSFQKFGNLIRSIPKFLRSSEASFGFRVACATMSVGIVAFLHDTQSFFNKQRLVWAMIMIAISMNPTSGASVFNFVLRVVGTFLAVVACFVAYYIVDGHTAGIIVFAWVFITMFFYIVLKQPRFLIIGLISIVTVVLVLGYELDSRKLGRAASEATGQPYYPIYELAPYRLACVAGGLFVAFIWNFFPYPITEYSALRSSLGGSLYLLANYYSIVHETVKVRLHDAEGDAGDKNSPGRRLEKERLRVFSKQMMMFTQMRTISDFTKWEVPIGGRFPKDTYDSIIQSAQNIHNYSSLISFASRTYSAPSPSSSSPDNSTEWVSDFRRLTASIRPTSHAITSTLSLLSASVTNGLPLPPYMTVPHPYALAKQLEELDRDILSVRHVAEPGYAAFAVIQISARCLVEDLERLLRGVRELVGELDFSFHVVSTGDAGSSEETLVKADREKAD